MNKQYNCISENQDDKSANNILDMIWNDNITEEELDKLLQATKDKSQIDKLIRYQYVKDVLDNQTKYDFVNILPKLNKKLDEFHAKVNFKKYKQNILYKAYNKTIKNRSIFWPFSLTAIAVYSLFFTFLSINNNNINRSNINIVKTEIMQKQTQLKFIDNIFYSLRDDSYDYKFTNLGDMNQKYDDNDISNVNNRPKKILTTNKKDILKL